MQQHQKKKNFKKPSSLLLVVSQVELQEREGALCPGVVVVGALEGLGRHVLRAEVVVAQVEVVEKV